MYKILVLYYYLNNKYNFYNETKSHTNKSYVIMTVDYYYTRKTKTIFFHQIITRYIFLVLKKTFLN